MLFKKSALLLTAFAICLLLDGRFALAKGGSGGGHGGHDAAEFEAELEDHSGKSERTADVSSRVSEGVSSRLDQILSVEDRINNLPESRDR